MESYRAIRFAKKSVSRKRAAKACLKCRRRKVRCDVTRTEAPCTNCRLDGVGCVVAGKKYVCYDVSLLVMLCFLSVFGLLMILVSDEEVMSPRDLSHQAFVPEDDVRQHNDNTINETSPGSADTTVAVTNTRKPTDIKALYSSMPFLRPPVIQDEDIQYLESRDCLRVPSKPILDEFIRLYFLYVHPMLPLVNEADFWRMYEASPEDSSGQQISLLLLQAMMFASSTVCFVNISLKDEV